MKSCEYEVSYFNNFKQPLKIHWASCFKFYTEPPGVMGQKLFEGSDHMINMTAKPYVLQTFKKLLQNQSTSALEIFCIALRTRVVPRLFKL